MRSCSAASRRRSAVRSARARSVSSSHASAASRPESSAARRSSGRRAAPRRRGAAGRGSSSARATPAVGDLLALPDADPGDERLPATDLADRRVGGGGAVQVQQAVERGDRRRDLGLGVDALEPVHRLVLVHERPRGDERRAGRAHRGGRRVRADLARAPAPPRRGRRAPARARSASTTTCVGSPAWPRSTYRPSAGPSSQGSSSWTKPNSALSRPRAPCWRARGTARRASTSTATSGPSGSRSCRGGR